MSYSSQGAVEARQLVEGVVPVAGERIDRCRPKEADLIVVAQGFDRDLGELRKLANPEHVLLLRGRLPSSSSIEPPLTEESSRAFPSHRDPVSGRRESEEI